MKILCDGSRSTKYFKQGLEVTMERPIGNLFSKKKKREFTDEGWVIVCTTSMESIDELKVQLLDLYEEVQGDYSKVHVVVVDFFADSMIQKKYISQRILKGLKPKTLPTIQTVDFSEIDYVLAIEDEYNHTFSYKNLSRYYKKQLNKCLVNFEIKEEKNKKVRGKDYADSTLV